MNWKIVFILSFCGISLSVPAQNLEQTLAIADDLAQVGDWDGALYYYERVLFFGKGAINSQTWERVAEVHRGLDNQEEVINCLDAAYFLAQSPERQRALVFDKAFYLLSVGRFYEGIAELSILPDRSLDEKERRRKKFLLGLGYLGAEDLAAAETHFTALVDSTDVRKREQVRELFSQVRLRKPKTARTLSTIFPGTGQFYAGDVKAALNSWGVIGAFVGLGILTSFEYSVWQSTWTLPWIWRYYQGGIVEAGRAVRRRNGRIKRALYLELDALIFESETGQSLPDWE